MSSEEEAKDQLRWIESNQQEERKDKYTQWHRPEERFSVFQEWERGVPQKVHVVIIAYRCNVQHTTDDAAEDALPQ